MKNARLKWTAQSGAGIVLLLSILLAPGAGALEIRGRVFDRDSADSLTCAVVVLTTGTGRRSTTDLEGMYQVENVDASAGEYSIEVHAPEYRFYDDADPDNVNAQPLPLTSADFDPISGVAEIDLPMVMVQSDVVVSGIIRDKETDILLGGAEFLLQLDDLETGPIVGVVYTCADGRFEIRDVDQRTAAKQNGPESSVLCIWRAQNYDDIVVRVAPITESIADTDFGLIKSIVPGGIIGRVTQRIGGEGIGDVRVICTSSAGIVSYTHDTDTAGAYSIVNIEDDSYTVRVSHGTFKGGLRQKTATVSGGFQTLNFQLDLESGAEGEGPLPPVCGSGYSDSQFASTKLGDSILLLAVALGLLAARKRKTETSPHYNSGR